MKAVRYDGYGSADVLRYEDVDLPSPAAGQVLLQVAGTTFNPADAAIRAGHLQQVFPVTFPHTPGIEVAGTVAALGEGVGGFAEGDAVVGMLEMHQDGAAADYVLAPAQSLTAAPTSIPLADAAALPGNGTTAWQALFEHADLRAGQRVLVNGAGGSVGGYAVQLAKRAGAHVIATASARSQQRIRDYGADQVIDHTTTRVASEVTEPVDVVLNVAAVSGADAADLIALLRPGGVFVSTVPPAPVDPERGIRTVDVFVHADAGQLALLVAAVDAGELHVHVAEHHPLAQAASVHEQYDAGELPGRTVLVPTP